MTLRVEIERNFQPLGSPGEGGGSWESYKPNFVPVLLRSRADIIHLCGRYPEPVCFHRHDAGRVWVPYLALLPGRFSMPRHLRGGRWALTPPFHPYRNPMAPAVCFLWHCLSPATFAVSARGHADLGWLTPVGIGFRGPVP